jgi:hypothetical protein
MSLDTLSSRAPSLPMPMTHSSGGMVPSFELRDVRLFDAQGRETLRLPRVLASLSAGSLLRLDFDQLFIDEPTLEVRRSADGRIYVAGLPLIKSAQDTDSPVADWFFAQHEFVIRNASVRWVDEQRALEPLILSQLDFLMRNGVRSHDFRVDAVLPEGWGDRLQLVGRFRRPLLAGKPGRWMDWQGQVFANFARVEIARIFPNFSLGEGVALQRGRGALRIWADISKGEWVGGVADVALVDAAARLGTGLEPLEFLTLTGRIGARAPVGGFEIQTEGLQFQTRDGLLWPGGNLLFSHSAAQGRAPARSELRADRLDLAAVSQIAGRLPLATATHALISGHPVKGLVETVQARWQGETAQPETYELRAKISGLDVRSAHAMDGGAAKTGVTSTVSDWPGVQGATLEVDMNQTGGKGRLVIARGALFFPGAFEDPLIPVETLAADAQWQVKGDSIEVRQLSARFANSDAQGELSGSWRTSDRAGAARFPGVIDLKGSFSRADGARVHRYLPLGIPADVRHYVRDSVLKGEVNDLLVRIKGDLNDIPFADPRSGEFRFAGKVRNLDYAYVPPGLQPQGQAPWPMLTSLTGELVFDRASMRVIGASARMVQCRRVAAQPDRSTDSRLHEHDHRRCQRGRSWTGPLAADRGEQIPHQPDDRRRFVPCFGQWRGDRQVPFAASLGDAGAFESAGQRDAGGQRRPHDTRHAPDGQGARARHVFRQWFPDHRWAGPHARWRPAPGGRDASRRHGCRVGGPPACARNGHGRRAAPGDGAGLLFAPGPPCNRRRRLFGKSGVSRRPARADALQQLARVGLESCLCRLARQSIRSCRFVTRTRWSRGLRLQAHPRSRTSCWWSSDAWPRWPLCATCRARNRAFCAAASVSDWPPGNPHRNPSAVLPQTSIWRA